eukprot:1177236-Prorocentrum_minimum.AAC.2
MAALQRYGKYEEKQRTEIATLDRSFTVPKIPFKGPKTGPSVQAVRTENVQADSVDPNVKDAPETQTDGSRIKPQGAPSTWAPNPTPFPTSPTTTADS